MKQARFDSARLAALSDGLFAIALTLLVLDLKLPALDSLGAVVRQRSEEPLVRQRIEPCEYRIL